MYFGHKHALKAKRRNVLRPQIYRIQQKEQSKFKRIINFLKKLQCNKEGYVLFNSRI